MEEENEIEGERGGERERERIITYNSTSATLEGAFRLSFAEFAILQSC